MTNKALNHAVSICRVSMYSFLLESTVIRAHRILVLYTKSDTISHCSGMLALPPSFTYNSAAAGDSDTHHQKKTKGRDSRKDDNF